jgi:hypothetical protein
MPEMESGDAAPRRVSGTRRIDCIPFYGICLEAAADALRCDMASGRAHLSTTSTSKASVTTTMRRHGDRQ